MGCPNSKKGVYWKLNKTLYGLARSAHHWYVKMSEILKEMGFVAMGQDQCVLMATLIPGKPPIYLGLYVDDFVYYSTSDEVEEWFEQGLQSKVKVDFMGTAGGRTMYRETAYGVSEFEERNLLEAEQDAIWISKI